MSGLPFRSALIVGAGPGIGAALFARAAEALGGPDIVVYNAAARPASASLLALDARRVGADLAVSAYGGFLVVQQAALRMVPNGRGCILLTGASAKGFANSASFAMGKFALRGRAQSAARELGPKGIHVAHFLVDGLVRSASRADPPREPDSTLDPEAIARSYLTVIEQERNAWTFETDLRPWRERF